MPDTDLLLICGDESFLIDRALTRWRKRAASSQVDVEVFDQPAKIEPLAQALAEMPLFDPERVILVRNPPQISGRKTSDADALIEALRNRAPTTAVCIVNHGPVTPAHPIRAGIKELGGEVAEFPRVKGRDLRTFVDTGLRERGLRLTSKSVELLLSVAGPDLGALSAEMDKLMSFSGGGEVAHADVETLVAGDGSVAVWDVMDGLLGPVPGRGAAAVDALLADGIASPYLLATLAGHIRDMVAVRAQLSEKKATPAAVAATLRTPPWKAERLIAQSRQIPGRVSLGWLRDLQRIDAGFKAGDLDDTEALRGFVRRAAATVVALRAS